MSHQIVLDPFQAEATTDPQARSLEADLLQCQSVMMGIGLRASAADLIEAVKLVREAKKGSRMELLRAWEGASEDERAWFVGVIGGDAP
jgi:hypothetical protein